MVGTERPSCMSHQSYHGPNAAGQRGDFALDTNKPTRGQHIDIWKRLIVRRTNFDTCRLLQYSLGKLSALQLLYLNGNKLTGESWGPQQELLFLPSSGEQIKS